MMDRLTRWWDALSGDLRIHHHTTALCVALFLFHYAWYSAWFVEDAAITFAYARNFALGDGFVTYVGGERVEGFSNPSWTLVLAALRVVGIGPWVASKLLGAAAGAATVVLAGRWARGLLPTGRWSALVPLLLAMSPQHVNWCSSGLENAFFGLFLTAGCVTLLREVTEGGRPVSALWFAALAITRPEAPLYVAVAGLTGWAFAFRMGFRRAMTWALSWGVVLIVPLALWHAWRFSYFAWEFPNTYYAKLGEKSRFEPMDWDRRGWDYLRGWFLAHLRGFLLPLFILGMTGLKGARGRAGLAISAVTLGLVLFGSDWFGWLLTRGSDTFADAADSDRTGLSRLFAERKEWPEPELLVRARVAWIAFIAILVPAVTVERDRDLPRVLAWLIGTAVLFFALYSGGDWMRGWRWVSMGIVPISVLLASGVHAVHGAIATPRRRNRLTAVLLAALLIPDAVGAVLLVSRPVTTPYDVHRRVQYMQSVQDRLNLDDATIMDVDMGAHLWWFGPQIVDMAGLVDVPIGHNHYQDAFLDPYVYGLRQPTFAHVHGSWASRTGLRNFDAWDHYIEVPAFPVSPFSVHVGNHVDERVFFEETERMGGIARMGRNLVLHDLDIPEPRITAGGELYIELSWRRTARAPDGFRAILFLTDGERIVTTELPPAYDYRPFGRWRKTQKAWGRHRVPVPADLPEGTYDIGLIVVGEGEDGGVWEASPIVAGPVTHSVAYAEGELRWPGRIHVVSTEQAHGAYDTMRTAVGEHITAQHCEQAESTWRTGRRALPNHDARRQREDQEVRTVLADCFATQAASAPQDDAVALLRHARVLDPRSPALLSIGPDLAETWAATVDPDDAETAVRTYRAALAADPTRAWDRRRLEQIRGAQLAVIAAEEQARMDARRRARDADDDDGDDR